MKQVLSYIETKREQYENDPFFTEHLDRKELSGNVRLAWAPCVIPFIMGYSDINKYVFRDESNLDDPVQRELNLHTYEEDFHWLWMLDDLDRLGLNPQFSLSDAARIFWGPEMAASRQICFKLVGLASQAEPFGVYAIVQAIEAISITIFKHCQGIKLDDGTECEFFGTTHYMAEAGHLIKSEEQSEGSNITLSEAERIEAIRLVDQVFEIFYQWLNVLFLYAKRHVGNQLCAYEQIVETSKNLPREAIVPRYLQKLES